MVVPDLLGFGNQGGRQPCDASLIVEDHIGLADQHSRIIELNPKAPTHDVTAGDRKEAVRRRRLAFQGKTRAVAQIEFQSAVVHMQDNNSEKTLGHPHFVRPKREFPIDVTPTSRVVDGIKGASHERTEGR